MPFKTKYDIYVMGKDAPQFTTFDKTMANVEFNDRIRNANGNFYRLEQTVIPDGALTKPEEYLLLVYRVRKLIKRYFANGRKHEDMMVSLEHEQKLDNWNKRTQAYIDSHPGYKPQDQKSHSFFILVSEWRKTWRDRKNYKNRKMGFDQRVMDEMTKKCRRLEEQIDKYIKEQFKML